MPKLYDYLHGRWLASQPDNARVYLVRDGYDDRSWLTYWSPDAASPFAVVRTGGATREFFHLEGDADGHPTRRDDPRVAEMARAAGWREAGTGCRHGG